MGQTALLVAETLVVSLLVLGLYELRKSLGLAALFLGLGSFQFLQVVSSIGLYVDLSPSVSVSPGSAVLFTGNVFAVLLLYLRGHAREVRQLIYGLVLANLVIAGVAYLFYLHVLGGAQTNLPVDLLAQNPRVLFVGTVVLYLDVLLAVLIFELLSRRVGLPMVVVIFVTMLATMSFDSVAFVLAAFGEQGEVWAKVSSSIAGKALTSAVYSVVLATYLSRRAPAESATGGLGFRDLLEFLTLARRFDALKREEERYALAARGANDGLWDWDVSSGRVHFSKRWLDMSGAQTGQEADFEVWRALVHAEDLEAFDQAVEDHISGASARLEVEYRMQGSDELRWMLCRGIAIRDAEGGATRIAGSQTDITKQKLAESSKDEFVSIVSHELRTPVTAIRGALGLMNNAPSAVHSEQLHAIAERNCLRLGELIDDLLDVQRIARGRMQYSFERLDLGELVRRAVESHEVYARQAGATLQLEEPPEGVVVFADGRRVLQVLANLISNAAKFSPKDGVVRIGVKRQSTGVRVWVQDQGPGVPEEFRARIFQTFSQAELSNTRGITGSGLGLSISKSIVEAHGGELNYRSDPGEGAYFYFDLPQSE